MGLEIDQSSLKFVTLRKKNDFFLPQIAHRCHHERDDLIINFSRSSFFSVHLYNFRKGAKKTFFGTIKSVNTIIKVYVIRELFFSVFSKSAANHSCIHSFYFEPIRKKNHLMFQCT